MGAEDSSSEIACSADCSCCPLYTLIQRLDEAHGSERQGRSAVREFKQAFVGLGVSATTKSLGSRMRLAADVGSRIPGCSHLSAHADYKRISLKALSEAHRVLDNQVGQLRDY